MKNRYLYSGTKNYRTFFYSLLLIVTLLFAASFVNLGNIGIYAADWTSVRSSAAPSTFSDGYVKITTANELAYVTYNISSYKSKNIRLANNIDMSGYNWTPIGTSSYKYSGTFDGDGHVILNMTVSVSTYGGLFGYTSSATIKDVVISKATVSSNQYAGGIVGYQYYGTVQNCDVQNSTIAANYSSNSSIYSGGIVGYGYYGTIKQCRGFTNTIKAYQSSSHKSSTVYNYAGGIVGYKSGGTLNSCANTNGGSVTTYCGYPKYAYTGGIAGYTTTAINTSYNEAAIKGGDSCSEESYTGGIAGRSTKAISDCFNKGSISAYAKTKEYNSTTYTILSSKKTYAEGVGELWMWDNHVVSGTYTNSDAKGDYKSTKDYSKKYYYGAKAYNGGIVGYTTGAVSYCYNTASVTSRVQETRYHIYFKQYATGGGKCLALKGYINLGYEHDNFGDNIAGYTSSSITKCYYYSSNKITITSTFFANQTYYKTGGHTQSGMSLSSWTKNSENSTWFAKDAGSYYYNTYFNINASSCSSIYLQVHYKKNLDKGNKTYHTISTGLSSTSFNKEAGSSCSTIYLSYVNGNSKYASNSNINGGLPYLKDMYW